MNAYVEGDGSGTLGIGRCTLIFATVVPVQTSDVHYGSVDEKSGIFLRKRTSFLEPGIGYVAGIPFGLQKNE